MRLKVATLLAGAFLFLTVPAFASPVTGGVFCAGQADGSTFSQLTVGGVTATAWSTSSTASNPVGQTLVCKNEGATEMGLGISGDADNEIDSDDFIQLTMAGIPVGAPGTLTIESVQGGESFSIFGSNTNGVLGTVLLGSSVMGGGAVQTVTVNTGDFGFLDITAPNGNVLLDSFTTPTPEPSTYLLMGTGLLMLGFLMRRKIASVSL